MGTRRLKMRIDDGNVNEKVYNGNRCTKSS